MITTAPRTLRFSLALAGAMLLASPLAAQESASTETPIATMELSGGTVTIALRPDLAPGHVERITTLANSGFYDGLTFHRVIAGFMAQTGDPLGNGTGGSDLPDLRAEFSQESFVTGTLGMARQGDPFVDSANSQFFIVTADSPHLNGSYTLFGEVIEGMEHVLAIPAGTGGNGRVVGEPERIVSFRVDTAE